jgi:endonuclease/exonuclease/phosphatase family metal-dependent hydrolase
MVNSVGTMGSGRVRIVTLNCLFLNRPRARLRVIGRLLKEMAPDVTCLQEIFFRRDVSLLKDDRAAFRPGGLGVAGGLVTLTRGAVESWRFERFRTSLWFELLARKGFLVTRFQLDGGPLTVVNTHLLANYSENWTLGNYYTRRQLDELTQLAEAIRLLPKEEPVIVAGDFNVPASSPHFKLTGVPSRTAGVRGRSTTSSFGRRPAARARAPPSSVSKR